MPLAAVPEGEAFMVRGPCMWGPPADGRAHAGCVEPLDPCLRGGGEWEPRLHRPLVGLGRVVRGIQHISESTWVCNS